MVIEGTKVVLNNNRSKTRMDFNSNNSSSSSYFKKTMICLCLNCNSLIALTIIAKIVLIIIRIWIIVLAIKHIITRMKMIRTEIIQAVFFPSKIPIII